MRIIMLLIILPIILGINYFSCSQYPAAVEINHNTQEESKENSLKDLSNADEILRRVENRYYALSTYKTEGQNVYSKKGFGEVTSVKREIEIEYSSPSQIKVEMLDGKNTKKLISKANITSLFIDGKKKEDFDDVFWALTSTEFGNGAFFEVGKLLILKERGKGEISSIRNLINPRLLGEEIIDERLCYKVQSTVRGDDLAKITYWVDKESFLIRQYERLLLTRKIPNGYFKTVETYTNIEAG